MGYTVKPETDAVAGLLSICMAERNHADSQAGATESKFYLPAGSTSSPVVTRLESIWATLFSHGIDKLR